MKFIYFSTGIAFAKQGDYKKAMQCYNQALDVDPKHRDAIVARGAAYPKYRKRDKITIQKQNMREREGERGGVLK